tara:strand:+ start:501 stop:650 length:150 start_codon:yes stop_codon:yes gene_type:complete
MSKWQYRRSINVMSKKEIVIMAIAILAWPISIPLMVLTLSLRKVGTYNG